MLGAKDVAFPQAEPIQLSTSGCVAPIFFICALCASGLDTGWTFYTPIQHDD